MATMVGVKSFVDENEANSRSCADEIAITYKAAKELDTHKEEELQKKKRCSMTRAARRAMHPRVQRNYMPEEMQ